MWHHGEDAVAVHVVFYADAQQRAEAPSPDWIHRNLAVDQVKVSSRWGRGDTQATHNNVGKKAIQNCADQYNSQYPCMYLKS